MSIRYRIIRSKLPANKDGYIAQVETRRTVPLDELAQEISLHGTTASKSDISLVFDHLRDEVTRALAKGEIVQTPLGTFYLVVEGTFLHGADEFDRKRHRLRIRVIPDEQLYSELYDVHMERAEGREIRPNPVNYIDVATGERRGRITPNDLGRVFGDELQFDPADPRQGAFFVAEDKTETRVRSVAINQPTQLVLLVPDLAPGRYKLAVRNAAEKSGELREGRLGGTLVVGEADGTEMTG